MLGVAAVLLVTACTAGQPARGVSAERGRSPASHRAPSGPCNTVLLARRFSRGVLFGAECGPSVPVRAQRSGPEAVTGYWTPTPDVIESIELALRGSLEGERSKFREMARASGVEEANVEWAVGAVSAVDEILAHYSEYRRQYIGIVVTGGARRVLINNFPEVRKGARDDFPNWLESWVDVDDGGAEFWRIEYDVGTKTFVGFDVNASA